MNKEKITSYVYLIIYSLFLITPSLFYYLTQSVFTLYLPFFLALQLILTLSILIFFKLKDRLFYILTYPFFIFTFFQWSNYILFKFELTEGALLAVFATNANESSAFLKILPTWYLVLFFLSIIGHTFYIIKRAPSQLLQFKYARSITILLIIILLAPKFLLGPSNKDELAKVFHRAYPWRNLVISYQTKNLFQQFQEDLSDINLSNIKINREETSKDEIHIIVIGESARRKSQSHYGYFRNTNKYTKSYIDDIILFKDAYSSSNSTIMSLRWTLAKKVNGKSYILPYIAKSAGFHTAWLSNQGKYGEHLNATTALASHSNEITFINNSDFGGVSYDENLLPKLEKQLSHKGDQVIFLHLLGSHYHYKRRFPQEFNNYTDKVGLDNLIEKVTPHKVQIINDYDNSILYTDYVVSKVIEMVKNLNTPATVTYFSDHGELLFENGSDFYGHGGGKYPKKQELQVPFYIWLSSHYKSSLKKKGLEQLSKSPTTLTSFIDIMSYLMGITYSDQVVSSLDELLELKEIPFYNAKNQKHIFKKVLP